jgi:hypothetical protein
MDKSYYQKRPLKVIDHGLTNARKMHAMPNGRIIQGGKSITGFQHQKCN